MINSILKCQKGASTLLLMVVIWTTITGGSILGKKVKDLKDCEERLKKYEVSEVAQPVSFEVTADIDNTDSTTVQRR